MQDEERLNKHLYTPFMGLWSDPLKPSAVTSHIIHIWGTWFRVSCFNHHPSPALSWLHACFLLIMISSKFYPHCQHSLPLLYLPICLPGNNRVFIHRPLNGVICAKKNKKHLSPLTTFMCACEGWRGGILATWCMTKITKTHFFGHV